MHEALTHSYKNYAWITSCILHILFLLLLLSSLIQTISYIAKNQDVLDENPQSIPLVEYEEEPQPIDSQSGNNTSSSQPASPDPAPSNSLPLAAIVPDALKEPTNMSQTETEQRSVSTHRPPRRAKSAWMKQQPQATASSPNSSPNVGQQLAQHFNTYMQQQKRPAIRGTSQAYDLSVEAYGRRILTAICDASRLYEKSVVIKEPINENIRCTITVNKDGKIQKIKLDPATGNYDMDKAIEGLCKVSVLPKIPETLATNVFEFTVYFRLGKTQKGINKVRFVPNRI